MSNKNEFKLDWGTHAALKLLSDFDFENVLDIGSGEGEHKRFFEHFGKKVFSLDIVKSADYVGDFMEVEFDKKFDAIWCSHVLEHQRNVGFFLDKIFDSLADGGVLAIIVPIHPRERLISGHLTSWSVPLLCYNLVMAGFDCKEAKILQSYELSLIVQKKPAEHSELRNPSAHGLDAGHQFGNIDQFFPFQAVQGVTFDSSKMSQINWGDPIKYNLEKLGQSGTIDIKSKNLDQIPAIRPTLLL